jgi:type I restriction enzyme, S subunit
VSNAKTHTAQKKALVPELRFKEFEGEWKRKKMGILAERIGDGLHGTPNYVEDSNIYFVNGNNLVNGAIFITDKTKKVDKKTFLKNDKKLGKNTLLISLNGTIGNIARYNNENIMLGKSIGYYNFNTVSEYFYHVLNSPRVQRFFISELTGSTIKNLSLKTLRETPVSFPSLPEQQKIASFLSAVDEKIQQLTKKKALLAQYKKGVMQQLFSQKLRFKDGDGNDYADWEEKRLGEVLTVGSGRDHKHLSKGDIPVFGTGGYMRSVNEKLYSGETVFIGRKGTIDKPFYYQGDFWTVDTLFYTHTFKNVQPKFIYAIFQQVNWKLHNEASGVPSLSKSTIERLKFDFPVIEEQQKIASFLSSIDTKIEAVNNQITQTQTFKKGLLQKMFV